MNILVIDGQGGNIGKLLVTRIKADHPDAHIVAVGTNALATAAMLKAGADQGATGENAVRVTTRDADVIVGPIGITIADALLGEITPNMAVCVGQSRAEKILLPMSRCHNQVVGLNSMALSELVAEASSRIGACK